MLREVRERGRVVGEKVSGREGGVNEMNGDMDGTAADWANQAANDAQRDVDILRKRVEILEQICNRLLSRVDRLERR